MWNNSTSQNNIRDREAYVGSIKLFIEIMQTYLKMWNLDYKTLRNVRTPDDKRIIFDVLTTNRDTGQQYTVHVDTIQSKCTVEQFMDCLYGIGSTSDRKVIIYKGDDTKQEVNKLSPEEYFVSLLAKRCDDIGMPFWVIEHSYFPEEKVTMYGPSLADRIDYPEFIMEEPSDPSSMNLPTKWDIQRMAFWALYFNTHLSDKYYQLDDIHCSESPEFKISDDLSILVRWTEDGICYVVSDSLQSAFVPWLWENRKTYLERYYPAYSISTYRNGKCSHICVREEGTPIHKIKSMDRHELKCLGAKLYKGVIGLRSIIEKALKQYGCSSQSATGDTNIEKPKDIVQ